jgi:hypothetical protein
MPIEKKNRCSKAITWDIEFTSTGNRKSLVESFLVKSEQFISLA